MSPGEVLAALALLGSAAFGVMMLVERAFPSDAARLARLRAILGRAETAAAREAFDEAERQCRRGARLAGRWFARGATCATYAWYDVVVAALNARCDDVVEQAARHVIRSAADHAGLEWYAARAREELAHQRAMVGAYDEATELLDEAEAIRRAAVPDTLALTLEMRARVALLCGALAEATRTYESILAGLGEEEGGEGPFRSPSRGAHEPIELEPAYLEEVLASHARVLYLRDLVPDAERALARLIVGARQIETIGDRTASARLHDAARKLAWHGIVDGARVLSLASAELASGSGAVEARLEAARCAWDAGDWRGCGEILRSTIAAGVCDADRAALLGALAARSYELGAHEEGEQLHQDAQRAHASFEPDLTLLLARASSTYAIGEHARAAAMIEARALDRSASDDERAVAGSWALERGLHTIADRIAASLPVDAARYRRADGIAPVLFLSEAAARRGAIERAERMLAAIAIPPGFRWHRAQIEQGRGWLASLRGRRAEARARVTDAARLLATTMHARVRLSALAVVADYCDAEPDARDVQVVDAIAAMLPERDPTLRYYWDHEARLRLREGDADGALALCDDALALHARWFGLGGSFASSVAMLRSTALAALGADRAAEDAARRALALLVADYPEDHPLVAAAMKHLATHVDGAERRALLERALTTMRAHGADDVAEIERELAALDA